MKLKYTLILLVLILLLPALFYSAYEIGRLNDTEAMMTEIYDQQQNTMLYSVNQYAWDVSSIWASRLERLIEPDPWSSAPAITGYLNSVAGLDAVLLADTSFTTYTIAYKDNHMSVPEDLIVKELASRTEILRQLIYRKKVGYSKIEAYTVGDSPAHEPVLTLQFLSQTGNSDFLVVSMMVNAQNFIDAVLAPKLQEVARNEFDLGIFRRNDAVPVYAVGDIQDDSNFIKRRIWLLPEHYLGIRKSGTSIQELARGRFRRSLQLIAVLDILLFAGAWFVYRSMRKEMELMRMKSDFVSNVSHELRTPLALIRMFAETLELNRVKTEAQRQEYYRIIGQETERLTYLINNILDFSKMEAGKKQYHMAVLDISGLVTQTLQMYEYHLRSKGFTIETDLEPAMPPVKGDENAIAEALINLLENASKYSEDEKYVHVRTAREDKHIIIDVTDRGIGIAPEHQKKIFEQFYRVSSGLTHNTKGSGLGLSIVYHIMKAHGGEVTVQSQPGKGSRFRLKFPVNES